MYIDVVRHIPLDIPKGICYGKSDIALPKDFAIQHNKILQQVSKQYDIVFTSPLLRCKLLAEQISKNVITDARLQEIDFGYWEMQAWDNIDEAALNTWMYNYIEVAPPNGESLKQLIQRVRSFLIDTKDDYDKKNILLVTHAGVIRTLYHIIQRAPIDQIMMMPAPHGEILSIGQFED